jgi:hypothetical protein
MAAELGMAAKLAQALSHTVSTELPQLRAVTEAQASEQPAKQGAWSKKEELGHLIDSATNNHVRFVRAVIEGGFSGPAYAQNAWVDLHGYRELPWRALVDLWYHYNALLAHLTGRIPEERLQVECVVSSGASAAAPVTLEFLIDDYVLHMQHHLDHILSRDSVTPYPRGT